MPRLSGVGGEVAAWEPELMVVVDPGSEGEQSHADPHAEFVQVAGAVSLQAEGALGGLDDRLDVLAERSEANRGRRPSRPLPVGPGY
jgi:hypothetical protein